MAKKLKSRLGNISLLKNNPNKMTDAVRMRLEESVRDHSFMLEARGIVVWRVPTELPIHSGATDKPWLFAGQEGQLVILGGNQRATALMDMGYEKIPDTWIREAKMPDGEWWSPEEAEHFVLMDNNQEGMSGENDYDTMVKYFTEKRMAAAGVDLSQLPITNQEAFTESGGGDGDGDGESLEESVETSQHGERDPALEEFISKRERVRQDLPELMEAGFYLCLVFETHGQKMEFLDKTGYSDKVAYDMFADGVEFAKDRCGVEIERSGLHFPDMKVDSRLASMAKENDQEPTELTDREMYGELAKDVKTYDSCLDWVRRAEGGEFGDIPKPIMERLFHYREWAEDERASSVGMMEQLREYIEADEMASADKEKVDEVFSRLEAERKELGMTDDSEDEEE